MLTPSHEFPNGADAEEPATASASSVADSTDNTDNAPTPVGDLQPNPSGDAGPAAADYGEFLNQAPTPTAQNSATRDFGGAHFPACGVVLAATPLGHPGDASDRLKYGLAHARVIAAEDTRRTKQLAATLGITPAGEIISNFDHNEEQRVAQLLEVARHQVVLVVSDAGMPSVSDPGYALVRAAWAENIPVTCFPGPSAVPTALALSGLPVGRFIFDGFAPRKPGARTAWLTEIKNEKRAVCFFESPHRLAATLAAAVEVLGPSREAAVCRELTKHYEEIKRGTLGELAEWAAGGVKGEISCVIAPADADSTEVDMDKLVELAEAAVKEGQRLKNVCAELASAHGVKKNQLYDAVIAARG